MINYDIESLSSLIKKSFDNNEILHLKNFTDFNFFWEEFIKILDYKYQNANIKPENKIPHVPFIRSLANGNYAEIVPTTENFHYHIWKVLVSKSVDDYIYNISDSFSQIFKYFIDYLEYIKEIGIIKASINFVGNEAVMPTHKDRHSTIFIQCIGSVSYRMYEGIDGEFEDNLNENLPPSAKFKLITLNPGDLLFMPKGQVHQVVYTEPRATLLLDLGYN